MGAFADRVKVATSTVGTGQLTLGLPAVGFQSLAAGGIDDDQAVSYLIEDGAARELGTGVSTSGGTLLTRDPVFSTNANALLNLSGSAVVSIIMGASLTSRPPKNTLFETSGTFTKEEGSKAVQITVIGGGGGGGSGRKGTTTARSGGSGGGGGGYSQILLPTSALAASEAVTVGAGGAGGSGQATDSTNGNPGTIGGGSNFADLIIARGGNIGLGGTEAVVNGGTGGFGTASGGAGGQSLVSNTTLAAVSGTTLAPTGGGAGGYITAANQGQNGGAAGSQIGVRLVTGAASNSLGISVPAGFPAGGTGGGGGSAALAGQNGGRYGGGGGGSGAATDGGAGSLAGGDGAQGAVMVVEFF